MPVKTLKIPQQAMENFGTILDILWFAVTHDVPVDATIRYAGCGSHSIEFQWFEPESEPFVPNLERSILLNYEHDQWIN